jgi:hypothetical protein
MHIKHAIIQDYEMKSKIFLLLIIKIKNWRAPKFFVRPKKGPTMLKSGNSWNLVSLPASNTKGGEKGVLKALRLD